MQLLRKLSTPFRLGDGITALGSLGGAVRCGAVPTGDIKEACVITAATNGQFGHWPQQQQQ